MNSSNKIIQDLLKDLIYCTNVIDILIKETRTNQSSFNNDINNKQLANKNESQLSNRKLESVNKIHQTLNSQQKDTKNIPLVTGISEFVNIDQLMNINE